MQIKKIMDSFETQNQNSSVMSVKDWLITLVITAIPLVGIIMLFVWAFGNNENQNKQNWAKAQLLLIAIVIVLVILLSVLLGGLFAAAVASSN